jgi:hypothetical protein
MPILIREDKAFKRRFPSLTAYKKIRHFPRIFWREFAACLLILCLILIMSSEGPLFPWINLAALGTIFLVALKTI